MTRSTAIQDRVAEAILDAAAGLLAQGGEPPSMNDVATAAGVARATLYRHFPTREQLLQALTGAVIDSTATRLAQADLDAVPVTEAIARVARVIAADGSRYAALLGRFGSSHYPGDAEHQIGMLLQALLQRGIDDGTFRSDLTLEELAFLLGSLLEATARMTAQHLSRRREGCRARHLGLPARHREPQGCQRTGPGLTDGAVVVRLSRPASREQGLTGCCHSGPGRGAVDGLA